MRIIKKETPEKIESILPNQIFVFGSNEAGIHGAGAAKTALEKFGAVKGVGYGLQGNSFAIPTKDLNIQTLPLERVKMYVDKLWVFVRDNPTLEFLITKIGCGLAGYNSKEIAPLFNRFIPLENCSLPVEFIEILAPNGIFYGYKAFDEGYICRNFQYQIGEVFTESDAIACQTGFHFCERIIDTLIYYDKRISQYAEVIGWGKVDIDEDKQCVSDIYIKSEYKCTDKDWNTGGSNSGGSNTGDRNSGNRNSGDSNSGNWNSGDWNTGGSNSGGSNTGDRNSGNWNSGNRNSGNRNSGNWNSGNRNSGNWNSGDRNSGNWNSGNWNSGNWNSGNRNSGNWNSGDRNSGDSNSGNWNSGNGENRFLCSTNTPNYFFNKISDKRFEEVYFPNWLNFDILVWKGVNNMTEEELVAHPYSEIIGGCYITKDYKLAAQEAYNSATKFEQDAIENVPNYDSEVLFEIFGIRR